MKKPLAFVTRRIAEKALIRLESCCEMEVWDGNSPPPYSFVFEKIQKVDGILTLLTDKIDEDMIRACGPNLRVISQMAVGFDNIDIKTATEKKIPVGHTPGVLTETTADFTFALLLSAARRVVEADRQVHQGIWEPWGPDVLTGSEVNGATLGIIGFGRIGQAVARRAMGFNMQVLYYDIEKKNNFAVDSSVTEVPLDTLLEKSDFVSIHINLSESSHGFFSRACFEKMKPNSILINTSRGGVINSEELLRSLKMNRIRGAALDVFETEPIPIDHPLHFMENVIITPHIASASVQTREKMALIAADNLIAGINHNKLCFCANPEIYL